MTIYQLRARLDFIEAELGDYERDHIREDKMRLDVLEAIAEGSAEDPQIMAQMAISTELWDFERHCA